MSPHTARPGGAPVLELADIQGNILSAYGKIGFPKARYLLLNVRSAAAGRRFLQVLYPSITSAVRWPSRKHGHFGPAMQERPRLAVNVAFTFWGLLALGVPVRILNSFPDEFIDGMARRAIVLGDRSLSDKDCKWDDVWRYEGSTYDPLMVHMLVTLNAQMDPATGDAVPELDAKTQEIRRYCADSGGDIALLSGHGEGRLDYQELSAIIAKTPDGFQPTTDETIRRAAPSTRSLTP